MAQSDHYDNLVIGSGEGGKYLAWHMARTGQRTAVIERRLIGGSCPNTNCLPSKNEIWSAKVADLMHHAAQFGSQAQPTAANMAACGGTQEGDGRRADRHAPGYIQGDRR